MTVKFEFTMSDEDAANLVNLLDREIGRISDFAEDEFDAHWSDYYQRQAEYVEHLKQIVLAGCSRVNE